jgi:hypothetical protein
MANEFKHKDPCSTLTQAEYIAACGDGHIFACQATGDIAYASSATVLSKLGKGAANTVLHMGGSCIPAWTASPSVTDLTISGGCITLTGAATDIDLIDNNASALSFDASGKAGIIDIVTTNCSEGVTMSGTLGVTGALTATAGITVGSAGSGADVTFHSATSGDNFLWDSSCEKLVITGTNGQTALCVADGNVVIVDTLYFYDAGGEYISSNGSVLAITGATTISSTLGVTGVITANAGVVVDCLTINACAVTAGAAFTIDATTDIVLDADGDNITFKAGSGDSTGLDFSNASGTWTVKAGTSDSDLIFNVNDGGVDTKVMTIDGGDSVVTFGGNSVKSGEIRILEDTSCGVLYTAIKVGNMAANVTYTLPTNYAGCNGMALTSTTGGVMSWAAAGGLSGTGGTANAVLRASGTGGSTLQNSAVTITDAGDLVMVATDKIWLDGGTNTYIYEATDDAIQFVSNTTTVVRMINSQMHMHDDEACMMSKGLNINQLCRDNELLTLKSTDVGHAMTAVAEADTFGTFSKAEVTSGGLAIKGYKDTHGTAGKAIVITGVLGEVAATTDTSSTPGVVQLCALQTDDSTGTKAIDSGGAVFVVSSGGTTHFLIKGNGDLHGTDTSITALDNYCDVGLVRTMSTMNTTEGVIKSRWDDHVHENICSLIDAGLYSVPPWDGGLLNISQLSRLHNGAIWQLWTAIKDQGEELLGLRQQLTALQGGRP